MIFLEYLKDAALLLSLAMIHFLIIRVWHRESLAGQVASGLAFGGIVLTGMAMPLHLAPGIIFDPRSVVLSVAGLWGGPIVGFIAGSMAAAYRIWLGGSGAVTGVGVIVSSVLFGLAYRHLIHHRGWPRGPWALLAFGLVVHAGVVLWMLTLPSDSAWSLIEAVAVPNLIVYGPATMILALLLGDLGRRFKADDLLRESEAKFRQALENIPLIGISLDLDGRLTFANDHFLRLTGWTADEILGKDWFETFIPPEKARDVARIFRETMANRVVGPFTRYENEILRRDGGRLLVSWYNVLTKDADGEILDVTCMGLDVTERTRAENDLRESEERFSKAFRASPVAMAISELDDGLLLDVNDAWLSMWGRRRDEVIGKTAGEQNHWAQLARRAAFVEQLKRDGRVRSFEATFFTAGRDKRTAVIGGEIVDIAGKPRLLIAFSDITEQKRAELALKEREELYRSVLTTTHDAFWINDLSGRLADVNDNYVRRSGYSRDELLHMHVADLEVEETAADVAARIGRLQTVGSEVFISRHRTKTGEIWDVEVAISYSDVQGGRIFAFFRDISERKRAEEALRESERRFRNLVEGSIQGITVNRSGKVLFANQSLANILGYENAQEILDLPSIDETFAPHERERLKGYRDARVRGQDAPSAYEFEGARKDGSLVWLENRTTVVLWDGKPAVLSTMVDISERKATERKLAQSQKMEVVGQLAGGTAHDFNNLLQVIQTNLELIGMRSKADEKSLKLFESARNAVRRGAKLSQQLLSFSRRQTLHPEVIDPNDVVNGTVGLLQRTLGEDIELETHLEEGVGALLVDPDGLENGILSLALNARAAMRQGGRLIIRSASRRLDDEILTEEGPLPGGDYVEISLTDNGSGMPPEVAERAFEPFFTTKNVGEGSGLGLSMLYGFVLQSHGHVELESQPGRGTTVRMLFPKVSATAEPQQEGREEAAVEAGRGTILVVEDDAEVRRSVVTLLDKLGYETREAENGADALAILTQEANIDLLFTDMVMPGGISGLDLARDAVRCRADLKVLLTSGYPKRALEEAGQSGDSFSLLGKPYSNAELSKAIRSVLSN